MMSVAAGMRWPRLLLWPLVLALVFGVVAMHHLASGHGTEHGASQAPHAAPGNSAAVAPLDTAVSTWGPGAQPSAQESGGEHMSTAGHVGIAADGSAMVAPGGHAATPAAASVGPGHGPASDLLAHLCMAVLGALTVLGLGAAALRWLRTIAPTGHRLAPGAPAQNPAPPPPVPLRLAQLQILRL